MECLIKGFEESVVARSMNRERYAVHKVSKGNRDQKKSPGIQERQRGS